MSEQSQQSSGRRAAGAFDIRNFIGLLLGLYGVILVVAQFLDSEEQLAKADGLRVNLWTGLALLVTALVFFVWARLRPIVVPEDGPEGHSDGS
ncbi:hypothetical protein [Nocardioides aequoreus]|uniref:hypothetical protein n=1 Tax=Nocardioides aequoreus TaxID=397278 RepID=UPI0004C2BBBE|nr:hypothetical protein [Nocardioides aequoreus]